MVKRGVTRDAFDKKLANLGKNTEMIAKSRVEIESMRMMAFKGAKAMDVLGNAQARVWVSAVNALALTRRPPTTPARAKVRAASLADPDRRAARALPSSRIQAASAVRAWSEVRGSEQARSKWRAHSNLVPETLQELTM